MSDYLASVDAGNGGTNAALAKENGKFKRVYFPSVRAAATGDSLGLGKGMEMQYEYVDWNGYRYVVGDDVIRVTRRNLERHMGSNRYGNEFHQFLTAVALAKLGVKQGAVDLTVFAPPGMYTDIRQEMADRFLEMEGQVEIHLKGEKKPRQWQYANITVWPEGIGAAACFILDDQGSATNSDALTGDVIILDCGAYTLDALQMRDGNFNPENLQHATWENGGIDAHIRQPIVHLLKKKSDDLANLSVDDIDQVIRAGLETGDYTLRHGGYEVNLQPLLDKHRERYAEWVSNNIVDGVFSGLRGIKSLILVGGGAVLIEDFMGEWYDEKLLDRRKHAATKRIHPVDFNCVGGLRLALMRQKQADPR